ncbi:MAG: trehalose-phosphatase [Anaerolineae bacterium]|nr:trehalose-phosphatase [Anaerolineae bacterium]
MLTNACNEVAQRLTEAKRWWLFLDYDGTLADFAPTPEHIEPDPDVISLLTYLAQQPFLRVAVISGRRLSHVQALLPVPGILLAGTYGVELQTPRGELIHRLVYQAIRPALDMIKPRWERLIAGRAGFFLEDKGWSLALHARFADELEAKETLTKGRSLALEAAPLDEFRLMGGHKFLEVSPRLAHKGRTVEYILRHYAWPNSLPLYLGDDDKDEEAFEVVKTQGGLAVVITQQPRSTRADCRLETPQEARAWLRSLPALRPHKQEV